MRVERNRGRTEQTGDMRHPAVIADHARRAEHRIHHPLGRMIDRYGEPRLARMGTIILSSGIALLAFIRPLADPAGVAAMLGGLLPARAVALLPDLPLAIAVAFLPLGTAFTFPCVTSLLSRSARC